MANKIIQVELPKSLMRWISILSDKNMQTDKHFCETAIQLYVQSLVEPQQHYEQEEEDMVIEGFKPQK